MALLDNINKVDCSASDTLGAGGAACTIDWTRTTTLGLLKKQEPIPTAGNTKAAINTLIKTGKLKILQHVEKFEDVTPDHSYETVAGSGIKKLILKNPYEYTVSFDNGIAFNKALNSIAGKGNYDLLAWDVDGNMWCTQTKAGIVKGFSLGLHQSGNYKSNDGTKASSEMLMLQLTDREEVDQRITFVECEDYSPTELDDFNDVVLTPSPIAVGATSIVVKATLIDRSHFAEGLIFSDFRLTKNGTPVTLTAPAVVANATNKTYTFTITAAVLADVYTIQTYDSTTQGNVVENPVGLLLKSNLATVVTA